MLRGCFFYKMAAQPIFDACHRIIERELPRSPLFWNYIKEQITFSEDLVRSTRIPTLEDLNKLDFGPKLASVYDSKKAKIEMAPFYQIYNQIKMMAIPDKLKCLSNK